MQRASLLLPLSVKIKSTQSELAAPAPRDIFKFYSSLSWSYNKIFYLIKIILCIIHHILHPPTHIYTHIGKKRFRMKSRMVENRLT